MWLVCLQIQARDGYTIERKILFVNKTWTELQKQSPANLFNKQPEFTAVQGTIHDFTNLKQDFKNNNQKSTIINTIKISQAQIDQHRNHK